MKRFLFRLCFIFLFFSAAFHIFVHERLQSLRAEYEQQSDPEGRAEAVEILFQTARLAGRGTDRMFRREDQGQYSADEIGERQGVILFQMSEQEKDLFSVLKNAVMR